MAEGQSQDDPKLQIEAARKAFEQEFERFASFADNPATLGALDLKSADAEQRALAELRTRHLGKKSAFAASKKMIGRVAADERAAFGQLVQQNEAEITEKLERAEQALKAHLDSARTAREAIDVTLPGRRPRRGHLHPITLLRERIEDIFVSLGYAIEDGREIETDFYNFDCAEHS